MLTLDSTQLGVVALALAAALSGLVLAGLGNRAHGARRRERTEILVAAGVGRRAVWGISAAEQVVLAAAAAAVAAVIGGAVSASTHVGAVPIWVAVGVVLLASVAMLTRIGGTR